MDRYTNTQTNSICALRDRYCLQEAQEPEPEPELEPVSLYDDSTAFASAQPEAAAPSAETKDAGTGKKRTGKRKRDAAAAAEAPESKKSAAETEASV